MCASQARAQEHTMLADLNARSHRMPSRGPVLSIAVHAAIVLAFIVWMHRTPHVEPFRLPGTAKGLTLLTYYSPGSRKPVASDSSVHAKQVRNEKSGHRKVISEPAPSEPPQADAGTGNTTES